MPSTTIPPETSPEVAPSESDSQALTEWMYMQNFGIHIPSRPEPGVIDEGVRDVVMFLWDNGFYTFSSCQGGEGHPAPHPIIMLMSKPEQSLEEARQEIADCLLAAGYRGFTSSVKHSHALNLPALHTPPWHCGKIEIEFWGSHPVVPYDQHRIEAALKQECERLRKIEVREERERLKRIERKERRK